MQSGAPVVSPSLSTAMSGIPQEQNTTAADTLLIEGGRIYGVFTQTTAVLEQGASGGLCSSRPRIAHI